MQGQVTMTLTFAHEELVLASIARASNHVEELSDEVGEVGSHCEEIVYNFALSTF